MIYTFYSYKGGVGRTMALANIAELFYEKNYKVLMVDWDLEAPGLEKFFPKLDNQTTRESLGVMDLLLDYKNRMMGEPDEDIPLTKAPEPVDVYPEETRKGKLSLLTAGRRFGVYAGVYAQAVLSFDWEDFYESWEGERYFNWLREQFETIADIILIDSRTGVTEMGGVCTYQLADAVVMLCAPNRQNLEGIDMMASSLTSPNVQDLRGGRPLDILIVPTRVERAEGDLLDKFQREFVERFKHYYSSSKKGIDIGRLWDLSIPYVPKYAYNEIVAVRERKQASAKDLVDSFDLLFDAMLNLAPTEMRSLGFDKDTVSSSVLSQEQRSVLLSILINQISPGEFRYIVYSVLGPGTYANLVGHTHSEKCISFMEILYMREREFLLPLRLAEIRPDLDLSAFDVEVSQSQILQEPKTVEHALLSILIDHISPKEFRNLVFRILGPATYVNLSGLTHREKCVDFMDILYQRESEFLLPAQLAQVRPDLDLSAFGVEVTPEPMPQEPELPPFFLPFENRKAEWEKVVLYPTGQYYLFDAPAGYGKTALLTQRIQKEFDKRNWLHAYISSQECQTLTEIFSRLSEDLGIICTPVPNNGRQAGLEIGKAVAQQWEKHTGEEKPQGLALFFDVDRDSQESFMPTLRMLLEETVPGIWDGLTRNSEFFRRMPNSYRVVVAGRYLAVKVREFDLTFQFDINQLRPFDYQVTRNVCTHFIKQGLIEDVMERDDFAAHLQFYSGGHPQCITRILELFTASGYPPVDFFKFHRDAIERIAYEEADWVRWSIQRDWRKTFDALCIYRRFDYALLGKLLKQDLIWHGLVDDEFDLVTKLIQSHLVDWTGESSRHLSDAGIRRLLALRRKSDGPTEFRVACEQAQQLYAEHMEEFLESNHFWVLEVLFEWLQARVASIDALQQRRALRQQFLDDELPKMLHLLVKDRNPRYEYDPLLRVLERDWEFRFVVNYYLRDAVYTDDVYQETLKRIKAFFAQVSEQRGQ